MRQKMLGKWAIRRRRTHALDECLLEIAYHYGKKTLVAEYTLANGLWGLVFDDCYHSLIRKTRVAIKRAANPSLDKVYEKIVEGQWSA